MPLVLSQSVKGSMNTETQGKGLGIKLNHNLMEIEIIISPCFVDDMKLNTFTFSPTTTTHDLPGSIIDGSVFGITDFEGSIAVNISFQGNQPISRVLLSPSSALIVIDCEFIILSYL